MQNKFQASFKWLIENSSWISTLNHLIGPIRNISPLMMPFKIDRHLQVLKFFNKMSKILLFLTFSILQLGAARLPEFILANPSMDSASPFYREERAIATQVRNLIYQNEERKAFESLKKVIDAEKSWRLDRCMRVVGPGSCVKGVMDAEAFYMWKKTVIHYLTKDPTKEITRRIWDLFHQIE